MADSTNHFLNQLNADFDEPHCIIAGDLEKPQTNIIAPLHHYGLLQIKGTDAASFLQGQTSCDVLPIPNGNASLGGYCTAKGRLLSSFLIAASDDETFQLRMRRSIVESTKEAFAKYIVFSKAEQSNLSEAVIVVGLSGEKASECIKNTFGDRPKGQLAFTNKMGNTVIQLDDQSTVFECWICAEQIEQIWPDLSKGLTVVGSDHWEYLTIQQGLAEVTSETIETFIPQMLNYEFTGHINFQKGCYTGQEVVARLHYKGTAKRRLYRCSYTGNPEQSGSDIFKQGNDQAIGTVVNCIELTPQLCEMLATITVKDIDNNETIVTKNGYQLKPLGLPYAITNEA